MFYQELVELCKGLKLTVFTLIGLIAILANPAFSFDKTHHKSSDSGINFQVRIQHDKGLCSGSLLSKKIVITSKYCLGSNTTIMVYYNNIPYKVKAIHRFGAFKAVDQKFKTNKIAYEDLAIKAVDQKIRTNKTADKDLAVLELQNAVAGDNINFVKIPTITQERAAFTNKTALTLFGFWGDPHHSIFGYANEYLHTDNHASESKKIVPVTNCPKGTNDGSYFCTQTPDKSYKPLAKVGDSGGAVTFKEDNEYYILGVISTPNYYPRLGALDTRKWLNKFYLELSHWKDFNSNKEAHIGDMYIYDDTYNHSTEYFGLIRLDSPSMRYWYFPANKEHTFYWAYLGEDPQLARNKLDMIVSMNLWGQNDRKGQAGDIFVYVNFYTNKIEMFTLNAACTGDRKYWFFPIDASNNDCWSYDGLFSDYVKNKKSKPKQPQLKLKPEPLFRSKTPNPF